MSDRIFAALCRYCRDGVPVFPVAIEEESLDTVPYELLRAEMAGVEDALIYAAPDGFIRWHLSPEAAHQRGQVEAVAVVRIRTGTQWRHGKPDDQQPRGFSFIHLCDAGEARTAAEG